jgi:phage terminase small subunit
LSQPIVDYAFFEQQQESPICDATHYRNSYCPKYIRIAQREWNRLVGELCAADADQPRSRGTCSLLRCLCALGRGNGGNPEVRVHGQVAPSGYPIQSPYVAIANRQAEIMMRIASEFGFTPASRSGIATPSMAEPTLFDVLEESPDEPAT